MLYYTCKDGCFQVMIFFLSQDLSPVFNYRNTTGATSGAGTAYLSKAPELVYISPCPLKSAGKE